MVAVKPAQVEAFLKAPPKATSAVLFYGSDAGLVSERAAGLAKRVAAAADPPGEILRIGEEDLDNDPDRLVVELGTIPMFGGRKIVRTAQSRKINAAMLKPLIEGGKIEGFLIVEAGALRADEGLRALFEKAEGAAAIGCYADEARELDGLVNEVMGANKLAMSPEARRMLIARLGNDRALSRAEVEKLALYALDRGKVEEADVEAIVGDASELAVDKVITAAVAGRARAAVEECGRAVASGESPQYVIIALMRQLQRLHRVRLAMDAGQSMDDALRALRPPLFFKQKDAFVRQLELWSAAKLSRALERVGETQKATRSGSQASSMDEAVLTEALLLDIARLAEYRPSRR
jgi:DNA polymerase-3 subunit delta